MAAKRSWTRGPNGPLQFARARYSSDFSSANHSQPSEFLLGNQVQFNQLQLTNQSRAPISSCLWNWKFTFEQQDSCRPIKRQPASSSYWARANWMWPVECELAALRVNKKRLKVWIYVTVWFPVCLNKLPHFLSLWPHFLFVCSHWRSLPVDWCVRQHSEDLESPRLDAAKDTCWTRGEGTNTALWLVRSDTTAADWWRLTCHTCCCLQVMGVDVSPDGKLIATSSYDRTFKLWLSEWCHDYVMFLFSGIFFFFFFNKMIKINQNQCDCQFVLTHTHTHTYQKVT